MSEAVVFDWDGTLLDSREALLGAWRAATDEVVGRPFPATPEEEREVFSLPGTKLFPRVAGGVRAGARLAEAFQRAYVHTSERIRPHEGTIRALEEMVVAGIGIGVVTSKARRRFTVDVRRIGVDHLIQVSICEEDAIAHKPDPAPVLQALRELAVEPALALMVGDTPTDIEAGRAAGARTVGVDWGAGEEADLLEAGAEMVVHSADELLQAALPGGPYGRVLA